MFSKMTPTNNSCLEQFWKHVVHYAYCLAEQNHHSPWFSIFFDDKKDRVVSSMAASGDFCFREMIPNTRCFQKDNIMFCQCFPIFVWCFFDVFDICWMTCHCFLSFFALLHRREGQAGRWHHRPRSPQPSPHPRVMRGTQAHKKKWSLGRDLHAD